MISIHICYEVGVLCNSSAHSGPIVIKCGIRCFIICDLISITACCIEKEIGCCLARLNAVKISSKTNTFVNRGSNLIELLKFDLISIPSIVAPFVQICNHKMLRDGVQIKI